MKVALFGGTGFVGSHIIKELIDKGYQLSYFFHYFFY